MNITDFCDKMGIKYYGISLKIEKKKNGKTSKVPQKHPLTGQPNQNDFRDLSHEELERRKQNTHLFDYIVMDTTDFIHIDVDYEDNKKYPDVEENFIEAFTEKTAYFKSVTKMRGKHFIVKTTEKFGNNRRPKTTMEDVEFLNGQWSYVKRDTKVYNPEKIYELDDEDINDLYDPKSNTVINKEMNEKEMPPLTIGTIERPKFKDNHRNFLLDLTDILRQKDVDEYDSWTRLVWALHNDEDSDNYDIAKYWSSKSEKFDEKEFNKFWFKTRDGSTIGSFIFYVKSIDETKFYKIKSQYFRKTQDIEATDMALAKTFLELVGDNYVFKRGEKSSDLYTYHRKRWIKEDSRRGILKVNISNELGKFFSEVYKNICSRISHLKLLEHATQLDKSEADGLEKQLKVVSGVLALVQKNNNISSISDCVLNLLGCKNFDDIEFDKNGYLFAFRNKVYDLQIMNAIEPKKEDYILTSTGFDYETVDDHKVLELLKLFETIFPDRDILKYYIHLMATCLYGIPIEKFFLANGGGGNGKGVINELLVELLGNYAYTAPNGVLLAPLKLGNCPEVAGMKNKRLIIYREPDAEQKKICFSTVKELTGGSKINARMNYSNDTNTTLCGTHIMECNQRPKLDGRLDESVLRRVRDIPFVSTFTEDEGLLANAEVLQNVYPANPYYKSDAFKSEYKFALFKILFEYIQDFHTKHGKSVCDKFDVPDVITKRSKEYIKSSDEIREWFDTVYETVDVKGKSKKEIIEGDLYVSLKDVHRQFQISDYYINQSKSNKRKMNKKYFVEYAKTNINFKIFYFERYKTGDVDKYNILVGFNKRLIDEDYNSSNEECDDI
tara:strand:+ start:213 stop:2726 length:2514 start_codon:yes stop_codon:yes gene_type:complete